MDAELNPEFHFHLDEQIAENRAMGMSRHEGPNSTCRCERQLNTSNT
jgi:hypothetical protein